MQAETVTNSSNDAKQAIDSQPQDSRIPGRSIVLVGASVRWAAQSARRAGYRVIGMDLFGDTDTLAVCEHFEQIPDETAADPERLRASIEQLSRRMKADVKIVGGIASISSDIGISDLIAACEGGPISVPPTLFDEISIRQSPLFTGQWLIKKHRSAGGLGVQCWDPANASLVEAFESHENYLQQRVRGRSFGVVAISNGCETRILGLSRSFRKRIGRLPFVYAGSIGPWFEPGFPHQAIQRVADRLARSHHLRGLFNLDLIRDRDNRWWLLEVNCRPSGSCEVIERAAIHGGNFGEHQSLMRMHCDAIAGHPIEWNELPSMSIHCKRIVYAKQDGRFQPNRAPAGIADIPESGTLISAGQPIATLLIDSFTPNDRIARRVLNGCRQLQAAC
ncbi:ATP-grasp domain-containing protein [Neorhodopirellula pilleata]|uniref:ATP-grasp domain protein n=1 Tax=Neorhodopirellula pilleata TaxID=2714738 RepID=A0A5C6AWQ3_9BACT|nr:ATP-grasp domain-containing protein [Neorhodopirellula pilleata]TWU04068.1 ATP-grasp domain protein [Neorhodopirellula pilleata]